MSTFCSSHLVYVNILLMLHYLSPFHAVLTAQNYTAQFSNQNKILEESGRFVPSKKVLELRKKLTKFMEDHIYPLENEFYKLAQSSSRWTVHPEEERLKELAKKEGLWNLWIPVCCFSLLAVLCLFFSFATVHYKLHV